MHWPAHPEPHNFGSSFDGDSEDRVFEVMHGRRLLLTLPFDP